MRNTLLASLLVIWAGCLRASPDWTLALPGWQYEFPADHAVHPKFKTEWWYFTGNLRDDRHRAYGYELTFFRQGVIPPGQDIGDRKSRFVKNDFKFAHFAVTDLEGKRFVFLQKTSRGAFGEAGFGVAPDRLAWMEDWKLQPLESGSWQITARADATSPPISIDLIVTPQKPPVIEGTDGVSQKAAGTGNASHYYSFTRLQTVGTLGIGDLSVTHPVTGESWFDHEWASNQLAPDQVGWNWFCCQFDDQTELMLYAMRRNDGSIDPVSSGTLIRADGSSEHLSRERFTLRETKSWHSRKTGATYPVEWQVNIPSLQMDFTVQPRLEDQELVLPSISYWEGATRLSGQRAGRAVRGLGYMELTGYAEALRGLQKQPAEPGRGLQTPTH